jgi:hypothetical protein
LEKHRTDNLKLTIKATRHGDTIFCCRVFKFLFYLLNSEKTKVGFLGWYFQVQVGIFKPRPGRPDPARQNASKAAHGCGSHWID